MDFAGADTTDELRAIGRPVVIAWRLALEQQGLKASTINRKLAALSSLFGHLVRQQVLRDNPCREVQRPRTNQRQGKTPAFSVEQARAILGAPDETTLIGLRDRALLSVGFQAGPRRTSIVRLRVRDLGEDAGYATLCFRWKGGHDHTVALHVTTALRIRAYLERSGHGDDLDGPLFRPIVSGVSVRLHLDDRRIDKLVRAYARKLKIRGRHSAHSMRATFITTALANGASLEEVQAAAGHSSPMTTKLYDKRGYNPERSATHFATY